MRRIILALFLAMGIFGASDARTQTPLVKTLTACVWEGLFIGPENVLMWAIEKDLPQKYGVDLSLQRASRTQNLLPHLDVGCLMALPQNILWERPDWKLTRFTSTGAIYELIGLEKPTRENLRNKRIAVGECRTGDITATAVITYWLEKEFGITDVGCTSEDATQRVPAIRLDQLPGTTHRVDKVLEGVAFLGMTSPPGDEKARERAKKLGFDLIRVNVRSVPFPSNGLFFSPKLDRSVMRAVTLMYEEAAASLRDPAHKAEVIEKLKKWYHGKPYLFDDLDYAVAAIYKEGVEFHWVLPPRSSTKETLEGMVKIYAESVKTHRVAYLGPRYGEIKVKPDLMVVNID